MMEQPRSDSLPMHLQQGGSTKSASSSSQAPSSNAMPNQFTFSLETPSLSSGTLDKYLKSVLGSDSSSAIPDLLRPPQEMQPPSMDAKPDRSNIPQQIPNSSQNITMSQQQQPSMTQQQQQGQQQQGQPQGQPSTNNGNTPLPLSSDSQVNNQQLTTTDQGQGGEMIPMPRGQAYVDITEYLNMPQSDAAKKLGIPPSTLSKRWKEAVRKRKWPYRMICKIDKEIMTLLHNVPQGPNAPPLPEEIETALGHLLRKRQEELRPVVIRI